MLSYSSSVEEHNRNRKVFMLFDLEPSKEVSGGVEICVGPLKMFAMARETNV